MNTKKDNSGAGKGDAHTRVNPKKYYDNSNWSWRTKHKDACDKNLKKLPNIKKTS